jgi:SAM-dependent methyltransferase
MVDHPFCAATYDHFLARTEERGLAERRHRLLAGAGGRVLEIGAGTGLNIAHYPSDGISEVVALEPDGAMRRRLLPRLAGVGAPYRVEEAGIDQARLADGSFDTIVSTLVLCTVPDIDRAARQIRRWMAPSGRLLFLEHGRGPGWLGWAQTAVTPAWSLMAAGCHLNRDVLSALRRADLFVTDCERFALPGGGPLLASCVQGIAQPGGS